MTLKVKLILHHDDPPCEARLESDGFCQECDLHPDTQSTAFWHYCPTCTIPLKSLQCPRCRAFFQKPS